LKSLRFASFEDNKLKRIPNSIGHLSNLLQLNLSHNLLATLPSSIINCKSLRVLNVRANFLKVLPGELLLISERTTLLLGGNLLAFHPSSCCNHFSNTFFSLQSSSYIKNGGHFSLYGSVFAKRGVVLKRNSDQLLVIGSVFRKNFYSTITAASELTAGVNDFDFNTFQTFRKEMDFFYKKSHLRNTREFIFSSSMESLCNKLKNNIIKFKGSFNSCTLSPRTYTTGLKGRSTPSTKFEAPFTHLRKSSSAIPTLKEFSSCAVLRCFALLGGAHTLNPSAWPEIAYHVANVLESNLAVIDLPVDIIQFLKTAKGCHNCHSPCFLSSKLALVRTECSGHPCIPFLQRYCAFCRLNFFRACSYKRIELLW
jgi:hypothetical protein